MFLPETLGTFRDIGGAMEERRISPPIGRIQNWQSSQEMNYSQEKSSPKKNSSMDFVDALSSQQQFYGYNDKSLGSDDEYSNDEDEGR